MTGIRDDYPDVVITDIKMPILNGLELIERASASTPGSLLSCYPVTVNSNMPSRP